ncbi:hypothetical protein BH09BAC1_BH09BAC1_16290 [soil metagenome]
MSDKLTDRDFWLHFWETKPGINQRIPEKHLFYPSFDQVLKHYPNIQTAIELGGFPGTYSVYLKKKYNLESAFLDYVVHEKVLETFLHANELKRTDIKALEADLFNHNITEQFDLVYSLGLIEHFLNTKEILQAHLDFVKPNGVLLIIVPNFLGLNGWLQKKVDKEFYDKHYLACMYPGNLIKAAQELGLKDIEANYAGGFGLWMEDEANKPFWVRAAVKPVWFIGKAISKILRKDSKAFSPYTYLIARKP